MMEKKDTIMKKEKKVKKVREFQKVGINKLIVNQIKKCMKITLDNNRKCNNNNNY